MSTKASVLPNTLVTVKVTHNSNTRRFKLPLKELTAVELPRKLRQLLAIPAEQDILFERYSDSSTNWVALDASNPSVYKQLHRAARAKLKLRIKATAISTQPAERAIQELDDAPANPQMDSQAQKASQPFESKQSAGSSATLVPIASDQLDEAVTKAVNSYCSSGDFTNQLRETIREEVGKQTSESGYSSMPDLLSGSQTMPASDKIAANEDEMTRVSDCAISPDLAVEMQKHLFQGSDKELQSLIEIYCNHCQNQVNGYHYHCTQCDNGDFDLCKACVGSGIHCHNQNHWLSRRCLDGGEKPEKFVKRVPTRICNNCVKERNQSEFVHCKNCKDFDLCLRCHREQEHGHDPRHAFAPADPEALLSAREKKYLPAGRGTIHSAFCDNCEQRIVGLRHKCIDCPNWDYCNDCVGSASTNHPGHRFVPLFDDSSVASIYAPGSHAMVRHYGIYCDGPVCKKSPATRECILGPRYKCVICEDTDFCATCEASPLNTHNPTHPLIKIKTALREILCTTVENGRNSVLGDRLPQRPLFAEPSAAATSNAATQVQTVAEVKPTKEHPVVNLPVALERPATPVPLMATFIEDTVPDNTAFVLGERFCQTWLLQNTGTTSWPAGVTCSFVGGAYMFLKSDEDSLNVTTTTSEVRPGEFQAFTVELSAPVDVCQQYVSYWRLTAPDGTKFGSKLWCSIMVREPEESAARQGEDEESNINDVLHAAPSVIYSESVRDVDEETIAEDARSEFDFMPKYGSEAATDAIDAMIGAGASHEVSEPEVVEEPEDVNTSEQSSQMIFPKLPVESPVHSVETLRSSSTEAFTANQTPEPISAPTSNRAPSVDSAEVFSDIEVSDVGDDDECFLTDEEYDVLDASDEEFENVV